MSNLAKLRANALGHLTGRKFRYPVCLEPEKRAELRKLAGLGEKSEVEIIGAMNYIEIWSKEKLPPAGPFKIPGNIGL